MKIEIRPCLSRLVSLSVALLTVAVAAPSAAQSVATGLGAPMPGSVADLALELRHLDGVKRVLMIAAHPDDEDTALLTALARGMGAEVAYLSLTRGDGGQNLIGPELFEGLGVVRMGELLAARRLDGARQYFTRAFDFGFSKSADEALALWPRDELLRDVVWVVRSFRPQIIVSIFSGTPADGHGQHQAAGIMALEAFSAAADPGVFPDQFTEGVAPWQADRLYRRTRGLPTGDEVELETGAWDPVLGRSHLQVAMASRSQHRSQDMGVAQPLGSRTSALSLVVSRPGLAAPASGATDLFEGVDTTLAAVAAASPVARRAATLDALEAYRSELRAARAALTAFEPWPAAAPLARALQHLDEVLAATRDGGDPWAMTVLGERRTRLVAALSTALGVQVRTVADDDLVVPGDSLGVTVEVWNGGPYRLADVRPALRTQGWPVADGGGESAGPLAPGAVARFRYRVVVPADAAPSRLHFRTAPRDGEMYRWSDDTALRGLPIAPSPVTGEVSVSVAWDEASGTGDAVGPTGFTLAREARFVGVDKATGEFTRPLLVVPALSVASRPRTLVWPRALEGVRELTVELRAEDAHGASGTLRLDVPTGFSTEPAAHRFDFTAAGDRRTFTFRVTKGNVADGRHELVPVADLDDGRRYTEGYDLIEYPHIDRTAFFNPGATRVTVTPVQVREGLRVGYVMGSGDDGPDALAQMGVDVETVDAARLRAGDLDGLDALVLGIRVYETQPAIVAANDAILDFARAGGTVVVQYNKQEYPLGGFAPWPLTMLGRAARVTDEGSPVRVLDPASPVFAGPNVLDERDFAGWVQERGLYFMSEWDARWVPQIAFRDPGEDEELGSLLVTPVGEGLYVYTGISFFRQFPAGVAGGYRLFANLVSLDRARWDAWAASRGDR